MTPAAIAVVVLYLTVHDADTGIRLCPSETCVLDPVIVSEIEFAPDGDKMEQCRKTGIAMATAIVASWRQKYPNAVANVTCRWERRISGDPA